MVGDRAFDVSGGPAWSGWRGERVVVSARNLRKPGGGNGEDVFPGELPVPIPSTGRDRWKHDFQSGR